MNNLNTKRIFKKSSEIYEHNTRETRKPLAKNIQVCLCAVYLKSANTFGTWIIHYACVSLLLNLYDKHFDLYIQCGIAVNQTFVRMAPSVLSMTVAFDVFVLPDTKALIAMVSHVKWDSNLHMLSFFPRKRNVYCKIITSHTMCKIFLHINTHTQPTIPPIAPTKGYYSESQLLNSLRWPIYVFDSGDDIKLPYCTR